MTPRALIFDMDGTLVDNTPVHHLAWQSFLAEHGFDRPLSEMSQTITGKHNREIVQHYWGADTTDSDIKYLGDAKESHYRERYGAQLQLLPGLLLFLEATLAADIPTAVCTSANRANLEFTIETLRLRPYFQQFVCADDVTHHKPHPEGFLSIANIFGVSAADCIVFEDSRSGIGAAANAGMQMVLVTTSLDANTADQFPHIRHAIADYADLNLL